MLAVGRALMMGPEALLLDEPSAGLAPKVVEELFEALAEIKSRSAGRRIRCVTRLPLEQVARLPGVKDVSRHGAALEILAAQAEPVVLALLSQDPALSDLEVSGAGLEQAFLALTREPRKEAA